MDLPSHKPPLHYESLAEQLVELAAPAYARSAQAHTFDHSVLTNLPYLDCFLLEKVYEQVFGNKTEAERVAEDFARILAARPGADVPVDIFLEHCSTWRAK